jgi:aspartate-semialdehyde dehydrogenase
MVESSNPKKLLKIAFIGSTGAVGKEIIRLTK